jgi:hypothetical protein
VWTEAWSREDWVVSRRGARWLQIAFWAEATLILVVPFFLYALIRSWRAVPVILLSFVAKLLLGSIGGSAAAGGMLFDDAMRSFALGLKHPTGEAAGMWFLRWPLRLLFGPAAYYWFVYRPHMREAGFTSKR